METVHVHAQTAASQSSRNPRSRWSATALHAHVILMAVQAIRPLSNRVRATTARAQQPELTLLQLFRACPAQAVDVQVSPAHAHAFRKFAIVPAQSFESVIYRAILSNGTPVRVYKTRRTRRLHGLRGQPLKKVWS